MKTNKTELVFILDKSGSMSGLESDTIGGFNSMLLQQQKVEGECKVTTVLFNDNFYLLHNHMDIGLIRKMTPKEYQVGGSTALLDAIGLTIDKIKNEQKNEVAYERADKVLFIIITDGEENSSSQYCLNMVRKAIEHQTYKHGWEFIFLGANIDAVETAAEFGISMERAADYLADSTGTQLNFVAMSDTISSFRISGKIDEAPLGRIRNDVKTRRKN